MEYQSILHRIIHQANENPNRIAIIEGDKQVSYQELLNLSKAVLATIQHHHFLGDWVPISVHEGWKSYASIIGVWLSGKGYLPIDVSFPEEAIQERLTQIGEQRILVHSIELVKNYVKVEETVDAKEVQIENVNQAYLIFTSGTTGKPKGVPIRFKNLEPFVDHYFNHEIISFSSSDRFLQSYELTFDVSVFCYLSAFCSGGTLILPEKTKIKFQGFFKAIDEHQVTVVSFVPSVIRLSFAYLNRLKLPSVRYSFFSGEALMASWAKEWMNTVKNAEVFNCYGPTETVIVCTEEHLNSLDMEYFESSEPLPLGKPFKRINLSLIDEEIHFNGQQVFDGYLEQEQKETYSTGDLASYDEKEKLIFQGRKDNQIQWNGYRIELEEIECVIRNKTGIELKMVYLSEIQKMVAFCNGNQSEVETQYKGNLPEYYLPSAFIQLDEFPLNPNGKYDWNALRLLAQNV